ncbi:MAG TPA: hypothetical protein VGP82_15820, partial [Ktedonobacterales bacterium]|nr:hypothetical protein [Ktedonobacterales bacterium]
GPRNACNSVQPLAQPLCGTTTGTLGKESSRRATLEPWWLRMVGISQCVQTRLGRGTQQPQAQVLGTVRPSYPTLHADENPLREYGGACAVSGKPGEVADHDWLVAGDERTEGPIGARSRLRRKPRFALLLDIHMRTRE